MIALLTHQKESCDGTITVGTEQLRHRLLERNTEGWVATNDWCSSSLGSFNRAARRWYNFILARIYGWRPLLGFIHPHID